MATTSVVAVLGAKTWRKRNVLLLAVFAVAACAPMGVDYERRLAEVERRVLVLENTRRSDLDVWPSFAPTVTDPATQDNNGNGVHDAYDGIGLVPLGPYSVGRGPRHIAAGRINAPDARVGLAVTNLDDSSVTLLRQRADKSFETETTIPGIGTAPTCIAIGDLDGDGDMDFAVGHGEPTTVLTVIRAIRPPELKVVRYRIESHPLTRDPALSKPPVCVLVGDFDGGGLDVVTTSGAGGGPPPGDISAITLFSNGVFFEPQQRTGVQLIPAALTAADFDGDGDLDVCVADLNGINHVVCLFNNGAAVSGWRQWRFRTGLTHTNFIAAGDLNGDGRMDLAVAGDEGVAVLLNTGSERADGTPACKDKYGLVNTEVPGCFGQRFTRSGVYGSAKGATGIAVADIDSDGDKDVAVTVSSTNEVVVLRNVGRGGLGREVRLPVGDGPSGIVAADLDADGRTELVVVHSRSNDVWVLHRRRAR